MNERPFYMERGFIAAAVFLLLLALVGVALALAGGPDSAAGGRVAGRRSSAGRLVDVGGSRCGMPVGNTDKPVGPPTAEWKLIGHIAVPSSPEIGPGIERPHLRACWAHSSTGALFAAASFLAMASDPGRTAAGLRDILAETHARNVLLRQNAEPSDPFMRAQIAGFRVTVASRDFVTVDLALQTNVNGAIVAISCPMRWEQRPNEGGDWRFMITDAERPYTGAQISDLSGFVRWGQA